MEGRREVVKAKNLAHLKSARLFPFEISPILGGWTFPICPSPQLAYQKHLRNSPERVRDTMRTFPERGGKHPGLETPPLTFPQVMVFFKCGF